jgi:hypothetical protein
MKFSVHDHTFFGIADKHVVPLDHASTNNPYKTQLRKQSIYLLSCVLNIIVTKNSIQETLTSTTETTLTSKYFN